ncbi:MAG: hypothetical protein ACFFA7_13205 [Promethearchaeota archaeon]
MQSEESKSQDRLEEFPDISIVEMITLQILLRYSRPVIRYVLFIEVNQFLKETKTLSTSSFYNSLNNLERRGYVSYIQEGSSKRIMVESTRLGASAINYIFHHFLRNAFIDEGQFVKETFEIVKKIVGRPSVDSALVIMLEDFFNVPNLELAIKNSKDVFVLIKKERQEDFSKLGYDDIKISDVINGIIREPNNFFDAVVISGYCHNPDLFNLSRIDILKESVRVTKKGGVILLSAMGNLPVTQNFFADNLLKSYGESIKERIFFDEDFKEDFTQVGISKYNVLNEKGLLAGIGWVT